MKTFISVVFVLVIPTVACANGELTIYAFEDRFVFDRLLEDGRVINIVLLLDNKPLKVVGQAAVNSDRSLTNFSHCGQYLIATMVDEFAVYDLSDPTTPKLVETLKTVAGVREYCRRNSGIDSDQKEHDTDLANLKTNSASGPGSNAGKPFLMKETKKYRYEVAWETEPQPSGGYHHQMFLNKVRKRDEEFVSRLWLGLQVETVCSE